MCLSGFMGRQKSSVNVGKKKKNKKKLDLFVDETRVNEWMSWDDMSMMSANLWDKTVTMFVNLDKIKVSVTFCFFIYFYFLLFGGFGESEGNDFVSFVVGGFNTALRNMMTDIIVVVNFAGLSFGRG